MKTQLAWWPSSLAIKWRSFVLSPLQWRSVSEQEDWLYRKCLSRLDVRSVLPLLLCVCHSSAPVSGTSHTELTQERTCSCFLLSWQSAIQAAGSAGMELKNIVEFYRQWKEIGWEVEGGAAVGAANSWSITTLAPSLSPTLLLCVYLHLQRQKKQLKRKLNRWKELKLGGVEKLKQWRQKIREKRAKRRYKKQQISHHPPPIPKHKGWPLVVRMRKQRGSAAQLWSAPGSHPNQEYTVYVSKWVQTCRERNRRHTHKHTHAQMNPLRYLDQWFGFSFPPPRTLQSVFEGEDCPER